MDKIFFTSDLHLCHDREFVFKPRGFENVEDMNKAIIERWNNVVGDDDLVYVLGDLVLGGSTGTIKGAEMLKQLKGKIRIILGNHDSVKRQELYSAMDNVESILWADFIKYDGYHFYLSHFPTMTGNLEKESIKQVTINLFGHTHSKELFYEDIPYMYNVAVDAHDCTPVEIHDIIKDITAKYNECRDQL